MLASENLAVRSVIPSRESRDGRPYPNGSPSNAALTVGAGTKCLSLNHHTSCDLIMSALVQEKSRAPAPPSWYQCTSGGAGSGHMVSTQSESP